MCSQQTNQADQADQASQASAKSSAQTVAGYLSGTDQLLGAESVTPIDLTPNCQTPEIVAAQNNVHRVISGGYLSGGVR